MKDIWGLGSLYTNEHTPEPALWVKKKKKNLPNPIQPVIENGSIQRHVSAPQRKKEGMELHTSKMSALRNSVKNG